MPKNINASKLENLSKIYKNEIPKTRFVDEISAVKVTLVAGPTKYDLYKLFTNVTFASWGKPWNSDITQEEIISQLNKILKDGALLNSFEMNNFVFLIEGVTRITTHALVRHRIGVSVFQQSTAITDMRHCDILVPRSMSLQNSHILEDYIQWCLDAKMKYSKAVDSGMSVQEARIFLPSTNANMIYMSFNLASLLNFYAKRTDESEEYLQANEICRQIKKIFDEKYPEISHILQSSCGKTCLHSKNSMFANSIYVPSEKDDIFDWNPESFLYPKTRNEMCWNDIPVKTRYFIGKKEVTENEFNNS